MMLKQTPRATSMASLDSSMIPAINIVFLLLIFFMIAGQIEAQNDLLKLPVSASAKALEETQIEIELWADGSYRVNGEPVGADLKQALNRYSLSVDSQILCRVHQSLPASSLDPLLRSLKELGVGRVNLATKLQS